jgi:hypothetical protein
MYVDRLLIALLNLPNAQRQVVRKSISLTLGYPKIQSKLPDRLVYIYKFGNISSDILSGSVGVSSLKF